jgi:hypothetical protein
MKSRGSIFEIYQKPKRFPNKYFLPISRFFFYSKRVDISKSDKFLIASVSGGVLNLAKESPGKGRIDNYRQRVKNPIEKIDGQKKCG